MSRSRGIRYCLRYQGSKTGSRSSCKVKNGFMGYMLVDGMNEPCEKVSQLKLIYGGNAMMVNAKDF